MEKYELDVHTHTIASGHAYSTISELVAEAKNKELKLLGIVEHDVGIPGTCDPIYFKNYHVVPRNFNGLDLILGIEININPERLNKTPMQLLKPSKIPILVSLFILTMVIVL